MSPFATFLLFYLSLAFGCLTLLFAILEELTFLFAAPVQWFVIFLTYCLIEHDKMMKVYGAPRQSA